MKIEPGTISFLVVFIIGAILMVKKWKKERQNPPAPQVRLVRTRRGRKFSVVEKAAPPTGKTQVRIGKDTIWVDNDLITYKEEE